MASSTGFVRSLPSRTTVLEQIDLTTLFGLGLLAGEFSAFVSWPTVTFRCAPSSYEVNLAFG